MNGADVEACKAQTREYQKCLSQMRTLCDDLKKMQDSLGEGLKALPVQDGQEEETALQDSLEGIERRLDEQGESLKALPALEGIERKLDEQGESLKALPALENIERRLDELEARLTERQQDDAHWDELQKQLRTLADELTAHVDEAVHRENVKVYRNVQAVVTEETDKLSEAIKDATAKEEPEKPDETLLAVNKLSGKLPAILGVSIAALLMAAASLVFQVLVYLGIL